MIEPYYSDDYVTIYHGDCFGIIDGLTFDVIVTDPPYGIDASAKREQPNATQWEDIHGDDTTDAAAHLFDVIESSDYPAAVFGANNFPELLPHKGRWVCWDKRLSERADRMLGSAFELAWLNQRTGFAHMIRCLHGGLINANGRNHSRVHPTEKPVVVMRQLIELVGSSGVVLDPFAGSGTTLRAAKDLGRKAIGIELEERYCEVAARRCAQEVLPLFDTDPQNSR